MKIQLFSALIAGAMSLAASAQAATVTTYFKMTVESIISDEAGLYAANSIAAGAMYHGSFQYDDTATNNFDDTGNFDMWDYLAISSTLPGTMTPSFIMAIDSGANDFWQVAAVQTLPGMPAGSFVNLTLQMSGDFGYNQGSSIDVGPGFGHTIQGPPALSGDEFYLSYEIPASGRFDNRIGVAAGSFMLSETPIGAVPLPAGLPLLLAGLGALAMTRRRRR